MKTLKCPVCKSEMIIIEATSDYSSCGQFCFVVCYMCKNGHGYFTRKIHNKRIKIVTLDNKITIEQI